MIKAHNVARQMHDEQRPVRMSPTVWLAEQLAAGPTDSRLVKDQAAGAGVSPKLLRNARKVLGIVTVRSGNPQTGITSTWALPSPSSGPPTDPAPSRRAAPAHQAGTSGSTAGAAPGASPGQPAAASSTASALGTLSSTESSTERRPHRFADHAKSRDIDSLAGDALRSYAREIGMTRRDVAELGDDRLRAGCKSHLARHFEDLTS